MDINVLPPKDYEIPAQTDIKCPKCRNGRLEIQEGSVFFADIGFHGFLACNACNKKIAFAGITENKNRYSHKTKDDEEYKVLKIEYIESPPHIIDIDIKNIPEKLQSALITSFKMYWIDINSCANKIRVCLELIMDLHEILVEEDGRPANLYRRIQHFAEDDKTLKEILETIKWIGNTGSHNDSITESELNNGYQLLEYALKKIYDNHDKQIQKILAETKEAKSKKNHAKKT